MNCRHCKAPLSHKFLDLGYAPPSNAYLSEQDLLKPEQTFPLRLYVCRYCYLVQTEDYSSCEDLFAHDYAYFSSVSSSWLAHTQTYYQMIINRLGLGKEKLVVEIASNDGYLLKNFVAGGIPCIGIEPTASTAEVAESQAIPVIREFFGHSFAQRFIKEYKQADLIIGNNVYAHVPDINDFTAGLKTALIKGGIITLEFPHLLNLIRFNQFDTVYHEHYSYLSLQTVSIIFEKYGLRVFDVEKLTTHGGSLRIYGCHDDDERQTSEQVGNVLNEEKDAGMKDLFIYTSFQPKADKIKNDLLVFLIEQKRLEKKIAAYGAAAKGNTLMNYAGIKPDLISFVCDAAPSKQGKFMPGSHVPIVSPAVLEEQKPDWILIFPWNIAGEVMEQQAVVNKWGGKFVVAVPELKILA